jgi:hypothetical protein
MKTLRIEKQSARQGAKKPKTRSFTAVLLSFVTADLLWEGGQASANEKRPVYLSVAQTDAAMRPFLANLLAGQKAEILGRHSGYDDAGGNKLRLLKSAGYRTAVQRFNGTTIVHIWLGELFDLEPGMVDDEMCRFISAPPGWWCDEQSQNLSGKQIDDVLAHMEALGLLGGGASRLNTPGGFDRDELVALVPAAVHFTAMLDRRTRRPLVNDLAFSVQLYMAALGYKLASYETADSYRSRRWDRASWCYGFVVEDYTGRAFPSPIIFRANRADLDTFLAEQVQLYQATKGGI